MRTALPRLTLLVLISTSICCPAKAADDLGLETGHSNLFNGHDLTGWKFKNKILAGEISTANKRFCVQNGTIAVNLGNGIEDLYTVKSFNGDFNLRLEFRASPRADSGVYIRGIQLQVRDYPTVGPYKPKGFKKGGWNELEIAVRGQNALCKCNGELLEKAMKIPAKGGIGLQAETGTFEFRHIRIKEQE